MKMKLYITLLLALIPALAPSFAEAKPRTSGTHMRPQLFHDRAPKIHSHAPQARRS